MIAVRSRTSRHGGPPSAGRRVGALVLAAAALIGCSDSPSESSGAGHGQLRVVNGAVEQTPVTTRLTDDAHGLVQVVSGLSDGDRVIVGNVGMLGKGMKVRMAGGQGGQGGRGGAGGGH